MVFVNKTRMWVVIFIASIQRIHFQTTEHNQMRLIWLFQTIFLKALQQIASLSTIIIFKCYKNFFFFIKASHFKNYTLFRFVVMDTSIKMIHDFPIMLFFVQILPERSVSSILKKIFKSCCKFLNIWILKNRFSKPKNSSETFCTVLISWWNR